MGREEIEQALASATTDAERERLLAATNDIERAPVVANLNIGRSSLAPTWWS